MATIGKLTEDRAPVVQAGVCAYAGVKSVHWIGRLSELAETAWKRMIKLPAGFKPDFYVVKAQPLVDPVGIYGLGIGLAEDVQATVEAKQVTVAADGTASDTASGFATTAAITLKGPFDGSDSDSDADEDSATYGLVGQGTSANNPLVEGDDQFVALKAAKTAGAALDRETNDCLVEFRIYLTQVDPAPEKMF